MIKAPILYAEDEDDDVFFVQKAFCQAAVDIPLVVVPDGQRAIDYLSGEGAFSDRAANPLPQLVLLDINMPGKTGLEVLKWIRSHPSVCALPVIMLTSSNHEADVYRAYQQGANGFLQKPTQPGKLLDMVKAIKEFWLNQNKSVASFGPS